MAKELDKAVSHGVVPTARLTGTREQRRTWIARRILDDLARRDLSAGAHVTEVTLAERLGVSRSPIRAALALLADQGVLRRRRNHGFFLRQPARAVEGSVLEAHRSPEDTLYLAIIDDRLADRLSGRVTQVELVRRYGVPEGRIVSVLSRLSQEGLVRRNPGRGWTFEPAINDRQSIRQSYAFRLAVEPAALASPGLTVDAGMLERTALRHRELLATSNPEDLAPARVFEVDAGFHEMLVGFSGNAFFLEAIQGQNRLRRMLEYMEYTDRRRIAVWCEEHLAIIDALRRGHGRKAVRLLRAHLERAARNALRE